MSNIRCSTTYAIGKTSCVSQCNGNVKKVTHTHTHTQLNPMTVFKLTLYCNVATVFLNKIDLFNV